MITKSGATPVATSKPSARRRAVAVGLTVLATLALWALAAVAGINLVVNMNNGQGSMTIGVPLVAGFTLGISLLGWGLLAVLERLTRRATTIWTAVAILVLLLSFLPVISAEATTPTKIVLSLMHIAPAALLIPLLTRGSNTSPDHKEN